MLVCQFVKWLVVPRWDYLQNSKTKAFQTLTDISGLEDAFGLMDFKVAGTDEGITAIQMDIKIKEGLARLVFEAGTCTSKNCT